MVVVGLVAWAEAAPAPIDPATLAGAWTGTWENKSFNPHPTGTVNASIAVPDPSTIAITYSASGGVFGQCTVPETTLTLVKGVDFTDTAVAFTRQDATFGAVAVKSKKKGQRLVGKGTGTCGGGGPTWNAKAKYRAPTFSVKMKIRLPGKIAKTTIQLAKQ
jgi:hypothetical protein